MKKTSTSAPNESFTQKELVDRLTETANTLGSKSDVSKVIGLSESQLYKQLKGLSVPRLDTAAALAKAAGVSLEWLAFGEGPKFTAESPRSNTMASRITTSEQSLHNDAASQDQEAVLAFIYSHFSNLFKQPRESKPLAIMRVNDDAMAPSLNNEDTVLVSRIPRHDEDGLYALHINGRLLIRRLQFAHNGIRVLCDNPLYKEQWIENDQSEQVQLVGKVVWFGRTL